MKLQQNYLSGLCGLLLPAGIFLADLRIKHKIEQRFQTDESRTSRCGCFRLTNYHNHGAMLNAGESKPERVRAVALFFSAVLSVYYIGMLVGGTPAKKRLALGMLLGGAWSNLYDRFRQGYVTDYISFPKAGAAAGKLIGKKRGDYLGGIVFNFSDFCILLGALLHVLTE